MTTHQISTEDTYIHLIKENISIVKKLIEGSKKEIIPFDPSNTTPFYQSRARHLQTMALLGITCEHLLKLIILSRGFSIFEVDHVRNVNDKSEIKYSEKTISFDKAASLFLRSNTNNYFEGTKVYEFNTHDISYEYSYLGYKKIDPRTCIGLIQKIRNNYLHKADSHGEWNGIIWYVYDFIIWLANKEFPSHFSEYEYIGNDEIKGLFKNEK
jgi:hypothetical protein